MLRVSETDFRSNFCLGGQAEPYELGAEEQYMVPKILEELKTDYVGIDFLFDQGKMVLNEIEDAVGARMLCCRYGFGYIKELYGIYKERTHRIKSSSRKLLLDFSTEMERFELSRR